MALTSKKSAHRYARHDAIFANLVDAIRRDKALIVGQILVAFEFDEANVLQVGTHRRSHIRESRGIMTQRARADHIEFRPSLAHVRWRRKDVDHLVDCVTVGRVRRA